MSETAHHDALHDDGFHEIQLSGKQLVALFMAATVVLVATFLCGVQIGRNVRGGSVAAADASDTLASASTRPKRRRRAVRPPLNRPRPLKTTS